MTARASGIAAEQHDLNLDVLSEWLSAALALSPLDDTLVNAWAALGSAWAVLTTWFNHADTGTAPVSNFGGDSVTTGMVGMYGVSYYDPDARWYLIFRGVLVDSLKTTRLRTLRGHWP